MKLKGFNDFVEEGSLNEAKKTLKRRYTESHPAKKMYSGAKVRAAIFDAVKDGVITEDEILKILKEMGADQRWHKRHAYFFDVSEDGKYCLSPKGKKVYSKVHESYTEDDINMSYGFYGTIESSGNIKLAKKAQALFDEGVMQLQRAPYRLTEDEALEVLNSIMGRKAADQIIDGQANTAVLGLEQYYGKKLRSEIAKVQRMSALA